MTRVFLGIQTRNIGYIQFKNLLKSYFMKSLFIRSSSILLLFLLVIHSPVRAQWHAVLQQSGLECMAVLNTDSVFVAGHNVIKRTFNGGETWQDVLPAGTSFSANDIAVAGTAIYVSGIGKILRTTDLGTTWITVRENSAARYLKLSFPTPLLGLAFESGNADSLIRTTDGGQTWSHIMKLSIIDHSSIQMCSSTTGYLGSDSLYKTTDGGLTWFRLPAFQHDFILSLGFATQDTGLVVSQGNIHRTNDGGDTWEDIEPSFPFGFSFSSFSPIDGSHLYYCGWDWLASYGVIYYSGDGGLNWEEQRRGMFNSIQMVTDSIGYVLNIDEGLFKTTNGGFPDPNSINITGNQERFIVQADPGTDNLIVRNHESFMQGEITIFDIHGRLLLSQSLTPNVETIIPLPAFPGGMYVYSIRMDSNRIESGKFLKQDTIHRD